MLKRPMVASAPIACCAREAAVDEVGGQVDHDEDRLEAADEERAREQPEAAVPRRLGERRADRLRALVGRGVAPGERTAQGDHDEGEHGER